MENHGPRDHQRHPTALLRDRSSWFMGSVWNRLPGEGQNLRRTAGPWKYGGGMGRWQRQGSPSVSRV